MCDENISMNRKSEMCNGKVVMCNKNTHICENIERNREKCEKFVIPSEICKNSEKWEIFEKF